MICLCLISTQWEKRILKVSKYHKLNKSTLKKRYLLKIYQTALNVIFHEYFSFLNIEYSPFISGIEVYTSNKK